MIDRPSPPALAVVLAAVLASLAAACGGDSTGPETSASVQVTIRKSTPGPGPVNTASPGTPADPTTAEILTSSDLSALEVTIDRVEVLPSGAQGDDAWVSVSVIGDSKTADLLTLAESGNGEPLASSDLDPGDYRNVRIFVSDASVTFRQTTTVEGTGGASSREFEGGTPHPLTIPGAQSGIELATGTITVPSPGGGMIRVLVDTRASVGTIAVSEQGLIMSPALTAETGSVESDSGS